MFSSKTYLAFLVIWELSENDKSKPLTSKEMAETYKISKRYLEVVFNNLAKSGIISSKRGIGGGYFLSADPEDLSIYDLASAAEGGIRLFGGGEYLSPNGNQPELIKGINFYWQNLESELMEEMKGRKLAKFISKLADIKEMYYI